MATEEYSKGKKLTKSVMDKYGDQRWDILEAILRGGGELYSHSKNRRVKVAFSQEVEDALNRKDRQTLANKPIYYMEGSKTGVKLSEFAKSHEFGGKGKNTTAGGDSEAKAVAQLDEQIRAMGGSVDIYINGKLAAKNVSACRQVDGAKERIGGKLPKADICLVDEDGKDVYFISYKGAEKKDLSKAFLRYAGLGADNPITRDPSVKAFATKLKERFPGGMLPRSYTICTSVKPSRNACLMAIYGGSQGPHGLMKCNAIFQGNLSLSGSQKKAVLTADHLMIYPEIPGGNLEPVFTANQRTDRSNLGVPQTEAAISPFGRQKAKYTI